jgi:AAHS family 4-hydroxybenzoate transporter-like MFS transporter
MSFSEAASRQRTGPYQMLVLGLVTIAFILDGVDLQVLPLLAPDIVGEWGIERAAFGWPLSAAIIGMGVGAFFGGQLADRFGRRNILAGSVIAFGAATAAVSLAESVETLTALRLIGGLGFGAAGPCGLALATEWMPPRLRTYVVAILAIGTPAGTMAAAALVPLMVPALAWRGTFNALGFASIALGFVIFLMVRESPSFLLGQGRTAEAERNARLALREPVQLEREKEGRSSDGRAGSKLGLFHRSNMRFNIGIAVSFAASTAIFYGLTGWSPLILESAGFAKEHLTGANFALGLVSMIGALVSGYAARAFGSKPTLITCSVLTCLCLLVLAFTIDGLAVSPGSGERWAVYALIGIGGGITSIGVATIYSVMALGYPVSCRSSGIGYGMLMGRLGGMGMSLGGGYLLDWGGQSVLPFFASTAACALAVSSSAWIIDRHIPRAA